MCQTRSPAHWSNFPQFSTCWHGHVAISGNAGVAEPMLTTSGARVITRLRFCANAKNRVTPFSFLNPRPVSRRERPFRASALTFSTGQAHDFPSKTARCHEHHICDSHRQRRRQGNFSRTLSVSLADFPFLPVFDTLPHEQQNQNPVRLRVGAKPPSIGR
jgi:hypothetical protein